MNTFADIHAARGAVMTVRNGAEVPLSIADKASAHEALRKHVLVADYSHCAIVEVAGDDAFECLDAIVAGDLAAIRDGQALYTFILDEQGQIALDLALLCDDERYLLLTEAMSGAELKTHLQSHLGEHKVDITDRSDELACLLFEGPYSWEINKELFGMDVIGLPFMEHMRVDGGILFRFGLHGEFSYQLICDHATAKRLLEDPDGLYAKYDTVMAGLDFQEQARLENPCWDATRLGAWSRCPIELQLQWMVRYDKDAFIGKQALEDKLEAGAQRRMVGFVADHEGDAAIAPGAPVSLDGVRIGTVATAGFSPERGRMIGQALLEADYAYADIPGFKAGEVAVTTSALPFVRNFSFLVNPLEHSYVIPGRHKNMLEQWQALEAAKAAEQAQKEADQAAVTDAETETV